MVLDILLFVVSLTVLVKASDWFVHSAENIGLSLGISPFVIGVTIIAFGTSLPELASSIAAVLQGDSGIVLGNVVGSNITNILLVLGLTAIIGKSFSIDFRQMKWDMLYLLIATLMLWFVLRDGHITLAEGIALTALLSAFLFSSIKNQSKTDHIKYRTDTKSYILLPLSAILVFIGAKYTIVAIEQISLAFKIPAEIIALSVVALGTSLPEVVVSIAAARKGKSAIAVGNVLGSNVFNTLGVVGIPRFFGPISVPAEIQSFSMPFMIVVSFLFALICSSSKINTWKGWILFLLYIYYLYRTFY